ncbi:TolC family outer membrane protein [Azohydromonas sediminis]|uniref:TolC family outer membrane protein n=1 Tax=Azohydromonas sediminis TaxID=2259674 RepID=UPI000E658E91|nr:TolC family outer membrane protein [Azohydromonas sediminis]
MPRRPTPRRLTALLLAAGLGFGLTAPLNAQTLAELFEAARTYDATYLAARAQADAAQYRKAQADALARPTLGLQAQTAQTYRDQPSSIPSAAGNDGSGNVTSAALSGRYPLFNRANDASIAQAERALAVAQAELTLAEQDLIVRLSQAYFDVLVAIETVATAKASKAAIAEQLAAARRNFEVGTATITDTREAQARFDLARAQEISAENDLLVKRIALDQLVGRTGVQPRPLALPATLPPTVPAGIDDWVGLAESAHPQVRRAQLALDVATLEIDKARAGRLPTVDVVASWQTSYNSGTSGLGTSFGPYSGSFNNGQIGVQLNWPLYTGGAVDNRIRETLSLQDKARNDLEAARRGVAQATRQAFTGLKSGEAAVGALEAAEASSKLALEATQTGYRVGVRVNLDVLNAQSQLFATQRDLAAARYNVLLGTLRLRQAAGTLSAADLQAVSRLLQP